MLIKVKFHEFDKSENKKDEIRLELETVPRVGEYIAYKDGMTIKVERVFHYSVEKNTKKNAEKIDLLIYGSLIEEKDGSIISKKEYKRVSSKKTYITLCCILLLLIVSQVLLMNTILSVEYTIGLWIAVLMSFTVGISLFLESKVGNKEFYDYYRSIIELFRDSILGIVFVAGSTIEGFVGSKEGTLTWILTYGLLPALIQVALKCSDVFIKKNTFEITYTNKKDLT